MRCLIALVTGSALTLLSPNWCVADTIFEVESNDTLATAQSINGYFTLDSRTDIGDGGFVANTSTTIPHVTIVGSGNGTFDYYSFYAPGFGGGISGQVIFDIDYTSSGFDSLLAIWAADGTGLGNNDDYDHRGGAGGSISDTDSLVSTYFVTPGTYIVGVARYGAGIETGGFTGGYSTAEPQTGDFYTLQISVEGQTVPEPSTLAFLAAGAVGLLTYAWRRRKRAA